jgi:glycosyltransferase involved in cell wall biosynthesis
MIGMKAQTRLNVVYLTMRFPVLSETFAGLDVRTLADLGVNVRVLTMRRPIQNHERVLRERGLADIAVDHLTPGKWFAGGLEKAKHPLTVARLVGFMIRKQWYQPRTLAISLWLIPAVMRCFAQIRTSRPDVVHLFWGHFPSLVGHLVERYMPDVVMSHFLGAYDLEYGIGVAAPVAARADVVWTHAEANRSRIEKLGIDPSKLNVVHRGVEISEQHGAVKKQALRIVSAGRLISRKAFPDTIDVFERVHEAYPGATMVIAGDGVDRAELEQRVRDRGLDDAIEFVGQVGQDALFALFDDAEIFLLMSNSPSERLPNAAKEAALRGCVCVTTETIGIDELFEDGTNAFIVPRGDVSAAAERVQQLFHDRTKMETMSHASAATIRDAFDVRVSMGRYIEMWDGLVTSSREK